MAMPGPPGSSPPIASQTASPSSSEPCSSWTVRIAASEPAARSDACARRNSDRAWLASQRRCSAGAIAIDSTTCALRSVSAARSWASEDDRKASA